MKILKVVHSFPPFTFAGTEVYSCRLSKELLKKHQVFVFFRVNDPQQEEYSLRRSNFEGLRIYSINHTFGKCSSFEKTYRDRDIDGKFAEALEEINPDVVHIHHLLSLSHGIVDEIKKRNIPIVYTLHDYWLLCYRGQLINESLKICEGKSDHDCIDCLKYLLNIKKYSLRIYYTVRKLLPARLLKVLKNLHLIITGRVPEEKIGEFRRSVRDLSSKIDLFIAPSNFMKNEFVNHGFPQRKIIHSDYGFNNDGYNLSVKRNREILRIAFLGTLLPSKGVDILISAFKEIKVKNIELSIHGRLHRYFGYEYFPGLLQRLSKDDRRIGFKGEFDNKEIGSILSGVDLLVAPSIWQENSPLVIHEAFLAKTPVIASRIGGIPELVTDGVNGLLFKPGDRGDLKRKLEYVIVNREILDKFRKNLPKIKSIEENAQELENIYRNLIS